MDSIILSNISVHIDMSILMKKLHIDEESEDYEKLKSFSEYAQKIGRPKVLYKPSFIDSKGENYVIIDGAKFTSKVLRVNLNDVHRVFPFSATCGLELYKWTESITDMFERYWADMICQMALDIARSAFAADIKDRFGIVHSSRMSPGSLEDWPISQQKELFTLLGSTTESIGVKLTDSFLMLPVKSVSGILFPTEVSFESCQLCPREHCPNRRAVYDSNLYEKKYMNY